MADNIRYVGNAVRKEKNKKNFKRSLSLALVLVLIIIAALAGLKIAEKTAVDALESEKGETTGYPVSFSGNDVRDAGVIGNNIVVLTKKFVTALDKKANTVWQHSVAYGDPAVFIGKNHTLVFDRYSNKYAVISSDGKIDERKAEDTSQIFSARVTDKGEVLMSLKSNSSACLVSFIDKKAKKKFVWSCNGEYIVDMGLSADGKTLYCAGISASGGDMYTKVYAVNIKDGTEKSYIIPSSSCIGLNCISGDKFNVITTKGIYVFDCGKDEFFSYGTEFNSKLLYCGVSEEGNIVAVKDSAINLSENILTVYSGAAKEKYSMTVQNGIEDIFAYKDEACVLYSDCVICIKKGEVDKRLVFDNKAIGTVRCGSKVYCYSLGGVEKAVTE